MTSYRSPKQSKAGGFVGRSLLASSARVWRSLSGGRGV